jgi:hypothetical protein
VTQRATDAGKASLVKRQRKLASDVEALRPSKQRDALRRELLALEKLLAQLGYRRLD